jgi:hypothetical protein
MVGEELGCSTYNLHILNIYAASIFLVDLVDLGNSFLSLRTAAVI